jgi:FlaA1/EpsC-like NDP-sugar epimerase
MFKQIFGASRPVKRIISLTFDFCAIPLSIYLALSLRLGTFTPPFDKASFAVVAITTVVSLIIFIRFGLYRAVVRYMTEKAFLNISIGICISALTLATSIFLLEAKLPRSTPLIYLFTSFALLGLPRLFIRSLINQLNNQNNVPVIIFGCGNQGRQLAIALKNGGAYKPVAFIDNNRRKHNTQVQGLRVYGIDDLKYLITKKKCKKLLLALGKSSRNERQQILNHVADLPVEVLTTPSVQDIVSGKAKIEEVTEVDIEDLLGREPVKPNIQLLDQCIQQKVVLITGAGGSIGSEICRQVLKRKPAKLILFELNEFSLYSIEQELIKSADKGDIEIISLLGSVQNQDRLESIFKSFNVETIYHAAAYKHVPMVEHNVVEGVRNNVFGTWFCAEAAILANVETFVLISTDKAVRPTNVMGTSKRLAELVLQALSERQSDTRFCMVRFGNVLGSSGSVVPLFRQQIKKNGPITVTHKDITRFFMTIPEAALLVIQAGSMGKGGDVYVLDMGDPVKITQLAQKMIHLSGLTEKTLENPTGDIEIAFSGLRPGEKLYEELLIGDNVEGTDHQRIMSANETHLNWKETHNLLSLLDQACLQFDVEAVITLLLEAPAAFNKQDDCSDWVLNASH